EERHPGPQALFRGQIEIDPAVDETVAEMSIYRGLVAIFVHELLEVAQVAAEVLPAHGGVLPALVGLASPVQVGGGREAGLAQADDAVLLGPVADDPTVMAVRAQPSDQRRRLLGRRILALAAELAD